MLQDTNALQAMSFEELLAEKLFIEAELNARADAELNALKEKLTLIAHFKGVEMESILSPPKKERKKRDVAAKYQHPGDPSLTWTGRGRPPAWMEQLLDGGAEKEAFALA